MEERRFPELSTSRLRLREHRMGDVTAVYTLFSDPAVTKHYNVELLTDPQQALPILKRRIDRFYHRRGIRWAITLQNGSDQLIGSCGFNGWNRRAFNGEIGYELLPAYWNRGYMTEAVQAIVTYGFVNLHFHRNGAWITPENIGSARVLEKVGFQSEGVMREKGYWHGRFHDLQLFSLLKSEFSPND